MRLLFVVTVMLFSAGVARGQKYEISYFPRKMIKSISFKPGRAVDGRKITSISVAKPLDLENRLESDSVVIISASNNRIVLNYVYHFENDFENGVQYMNTSYFLSQKDVRFLQNEQISKIGLTVSGQLLEFRLKDVSAKSFTEMARYY